MFGIDDAIRILISSHPSIRRPEDAAFVIVRAAAEYAGWRSGSTSPTKPLSTSKTDDAAETKRRESVILNSTGGCWPTYNLARADTSGRSLIGIRAFAFELPDMIVFARTHDVQNERISDVPTRDVAFKLPAALSAFTVPKSADGWSVHPALAGLWPPIAAALALLPVPTTMTNIPKKSTIVVQLPPIVGPAKTGAVNTKPPLCRPISAPAVTAVAGHRRRSAFDKPSARRASVPTHNPAGRLVPVDQPPPIDVAVFSGVFDGHKPTTVGQQTVRELERVFVEPLAAVPTPSSAVVAEINTKPSSSATMVQFGRVASSVLSSDNNNDAVFADLNPFRYLQRPNNDDEWTGWPSDEPAAKPKTPTIQIAADSKDAGIVVAAVDAVDVDPFADNPFDDASAADHPDRSSKPSVVRLPSL